ncbi:polyprenyl synthetase family protein [uncultured Salinisphaera sp.]|uniref:polyprenyl synthetase family protein n=1 Tax=uncultured Salinisphaera sp. TaxID=359372 RepID=UPI0032B2CD0C|tara:strand:+ start:929 stop:1798 length:870 start_codon:yes stop_codon:yes gene_type:complete
MDHDHRIEQILGDLVDRRTANPCPSHLAAAVRDAVFPGGARVRPRLCLAVAEACGDDRPAMSAAAASAIELMHCASLVHDDMPCFDDADTRRGKPSIHQRHGAGVALLTGDALIVLAYQALAEAGSVSPTRHLTLSHILGEASGLARGIVAGQAMEVESSIEIEAYHRAKTGALFGAATMLGAAAAGHDPAPWAQLGDRIGQAYQIVDDIRDMTLDSDALGKPAGQDARLARPSAVQTYGALAARARFDGLLADIVTDIPACPGAEALRARIRDESASFFPALSAEPAA